MKEFSQSFAFLNILLNTRLPVSVEELVAASLRQMSAVNDDRHTYLVAAGKELAGLLGNEYNRLRAILGRLQE
jgi:predicted Mrr-cat superfamily restriction endonuclease